MTITRETLELSAKAAGYSELRWLDSGYLEVRSIFEGRHIFDPQYDRGQLLEFAITCGIGIRPLHDCIEYFAWGKVNIRSVDCQDFAALAEAVITAAAEQQRAKEGWQ